MGSVKGVLRTISCIPFGRRSRWLGKHLEDIPHRVINLWVSMDCNLGKGTAIWASDNGQGTAKHGGDGEGRGVPFYVGVAVEEAVRRSICWTYQTKISSLVSFLLSMFRKAFNWI
jgi:hypothetical protein